MSQKKKKSTSHLSVCGLFFFFFFCHFVKVAGPELGGVRIDSGDLGPVTRRVRKQLDELGNHNTKIVVSSDLDEFAIAGLRGDPVDVYEGPRVCGSAGDWDVVAVASLEVGELRLAEQFSKQAHREVEVVVFLHVQVDEDPVGLARGVFGNLRQA